MQLRLEGPLLWDGHWQRMGGASFKAQGGFMC